MSVKTAAWARTQATLVEFGAGQLVNALVYGRDGSVAWRLRDKETQLGVAREFLDAFEVRDWRLDPALDPHPEDVGDGLEAVLSAVQVIYGKHYTKLRKLQKLVQEALQE